MDRRTMKTRTAIVNAYKQLLRESGSITVQRIIDLANIGRSTFYTHFSDKSSLPREIFNELFYHIGNQTPPYPSNDMDTLGFPRMSPEEQSTAKYQLERLFSHLLVHLDREQSVYVKLFRSDGSEWFLYDFSLCFKSFLSTYVLSVLLPQPESIPEELYLQYLIDSFITVAKWCFFSKERFTPYEVAQMYVQFIHPQN